MDAWGEAWMIRAKQLETAIRAAIESLADQDETAVFVILRTALGDEQEHEDVR